VEEVLIAVRLTQSSTLKFVTWVCEMFQTKYQFGAAHITAELQCSNGSQGDRAVHIVLEQCSIGSRGVHKPGA